MTQNGTIKYTKNGTVENIVPSNKLQSINKNDNHYVKIGGVFVWDKLFKKNIIDEHKLQFNEDINFAEDFLFLFNYKMYASKMSFVHKCLYRYTENRKSSARNSNNNILDIIKVMHVIIESPSISNKTHDFMSDIGDIAVGYYIRRINNIIKTNPDYTKRFVKCFLEFFELYIPNWKEKIVYYHSKGNLLLKLVNHYRISYTCINIFAKAHSICRWISRRQSTI